MKKKLILSNQKDKKCGDFTASGRDIGSKGEHLEKGERGGLLPLAEKRVRKNGTAGQILEIGRTEEVSQGGLEGAKKNSRLGNRGKRKKTRISDYREPGGNAAEARGKAVPSTAGPRKSSLERKKS